jgi:hypothetical protein
MMGFFLSVRLLVIGADCLRRATPFCLSAVLSVAVMLSGCSIAEHGAVRSEPPAVVTHPANFDAALRKNEAELAGRATAAASDFIISALFLRIPVTRNGIRPERSSRSERWSRNTRGALSRNKQKAGLSF